MFFTGNHTSYQVHNYAHESSTICKKNFEHFSWHPHQFLLPHSFQNGECLRIVWQKKELWWFRSSWPLFLLHMTIFLEANHGKSLETKAWIHRLELGGQPMVHGPWSWPRSCLTEINCIESSPEWELITFHFKRFYALCITSFIAYCRFSVKSQTAFGHLCHKTMQLCVFRQPFVFFFKDDLDVDRHWPLKLDLKISQSTTILSFFLHFQAGCPVSWPLWTGQTM